jgi:hypothetical protein
MPMMHAAWSIGVAAGAGIGAACAALGVSPAAQFIAEAVLIAAAAIVTAAGIPGGSRASAGEPPQDRGARLRQWLRGWLDWRLLLIGVVMLGVELGEGSAGNWLTLAARNGHGPGRRGRRAVRRRVRRQRGDHPDLRRPHRRSPRTRPYHPRDHGPRHRRRGAVHPGGNPWIVLVGVLLWAVGVSMGFPLGMSAAAESGPDPAARVSVVASIGYFANLAGPPVIGRARPVRGPAQRPVAHRRAVLRRLRRGRLIPPAPGRL